MSNANLTLDHFDSQEFIRDGKNWFNLCSPELLVKLDLLREEWKNPIHISSDSDAIGRHLGEDNTSKHNVDRWGVVLAIDVFPEKPKPYSYEDFYHCALSVGFRGVGFYPYWRMRMGKKMLEGGFHLDVRKDRTMKNFASWGHNGGFCSIKEVLDLDWHLKYK